MYKLLIIDDETLVIQYLSALLDWPAVGFELPLTAMTASRAEALFAENRVDVVLTDVRLPEADGVMLADRLRALNPDCKCIILTAYRDFEVVQRSVHTGVSAFMLKHELDADMLTDALHKAVEELEKERRLRQAALSHWLRERLYHGGMAAIPNEVPSLRLHWQLIFLKSAQWAFLGACPPTSEPTEEVEYPLLAETAFAHGVRVLLLAIDEGESGECFTKVPAEGAVVLTSKRYSRLEEVPDDGLVRRLEESVLLDGPCRISAEAFLALPEAVLEFPPDYAEKAMEYIRSADGQLREWVLAPLRRLVRGTRCRVDAFQPLKQLLQALREAVSEAPEMLSPPLDFSSLGSVDELMASLALALDAALNIANGVVDSGAVYARQAAMIIKTEYGQQLRTADIARRLYISEGYLRMVFKRLYDCTFSEYIRRTRVEKACALLRSGRYRAYEIANMCGFAGSQHFNQVFRQEKGMSPSQYARAHRG